MEIKRPGYFGRLGLLSVAGVVGGRLALVCSTLALWESLFPEEFFLGLRSPMLVCALLADSLAGVFGGELGLLAGLRDEGFLVLGFESEDFLSDFFS